MVRHEGSWLGWSVSWHAFSSTQPQRATAHPCASHLGAADAVAVVELRALRVQQHLGRTLWGQCVSSRSPEHSVSRRHPQRHKTQVPDYPGPTCLRRSKK